VRYTLAEIEAMPTLHQGQYDDLKQEVPGKLKIWLSRCGVEDGMPYDNQVTVERLIDGVWTTVEEYEAR
jgi:hypothetical protein